MRLAGVVLGIAVLGTAAQAASVKLAPSPTQRQVGEADRNCQFALQALKSGNVNKAKSLYTKALKVFPEFPDALTGLGHVALSERRFGEALMDFKRARSAYQTFSGALFELQMERFHYSQGLIASLRDQIRDTQRLITTRTKEGGNTGRLEQHVTELEARIQQLETVKAPDATGVTEPGELHFYLGNALFNMNRLDEALDEWETCARMAPHFSLVYNNLAVAYWKKGELDRAIGSLSRAERLGLPVNPAFKADLERSAAEGNLPVAQTAGETRLGSH